MDNSKLIFNKLIPFKLALQRVCLMQLLSLAVSLNNLLFPSIKATYKNWLRLPLLHVYHSHF